MYTITESIGGKFYKAPTYLTFEEYQKQEAQKSKLDYLTIINLVKKYSGENWKRFLGMLVKTSDEIKEILK